MCHRKRLFGKRPFKESMGRRRGVGVWKTIRKSWDVVGSKISFEVEDENN